MIRYRFALLQDIDRIMQFIDKFWKKNHILSKNKELFLYDFLEEEKINMGLALDDDQIVGIFGFMKYNYSNIPDIAGSLWKVRDDYHIPLVGIKLRNFVLKNIKHRFFAAPGANLDTKPIYEVLGETFYKMNQWYIINDKISTYKIIKINKKEILSNNFKYYLKLDTSVKIKKISIKDLNYFEFSPKVYPFKDRKYIIKRFFDYPFYEYDIYGVFRKNKIETMFIARRVKVNDREAYRIVDFYGNADNIKHIGVFLYKYILENDLEYVDFLEYGIGEEFFLDNFFKKRINNEVIIPHYFEPFIQENKDIYGVAYSGYNFRQFKADGDQDRPNLILESLKCF